MSCYLGLDFIAAASATKARYLSRLPKANRQCWNAQRDWRRSRVDHTKSCMKFIIVGLRCSIENHGRNALRRYRYLGLSRRYGAIIIRSDLFYINRLYVQHRRNTAAPFTASARGEMWEENRCRIARIYSIRAKIILNPHRTSAAREKHKAKSTNNSHQPENRWR